MIHSELILLGMINLLKYILDVDFGFLKQAVA